MKVGLPPQRESETKMVSAKEKSENRQHRNRSRSSTEQVASWQDHADWRLQQINKVFFVL